MDPTTTAIGTWSGGRFMHFGEPLAERSTAVAAASGRRHRHGHHRRRLRRRRGGPRARPRACGRGARGLLHRRRDRPRLLRGRARRREGLSPLHRPAPAPRGCLRRVHPDGHRAQPRALRRRALRSAAAAQPRQHRLHQRGRLGGDAGRPRAGTDAPARSRAGTGQRLHPRLDRLPGALLGADRLGDDHPQPARALARASSRWRPPRPTT